MKLKQTRALSPPWKSSKSTLNSSASFTSAFRRRKRLTRWRKRRTNKRSQFILSEKLESNAKKKMEKKVKLARKTN